MFTVVILLVMKDMRYYRMKCLLFFACCLECQVPNKLMFGFEFNTGLKEEPDTGNVGKNEEDCHSCLHFRGRQTTFAKKKNIDADRGLRPSCLSARH